MTLNTFIDNLKDELVTFEMLYRKQHSANKDENPLDRPEDDWDAQFNAWRTMRQED